MQVVTICHICITLHIIIKTTLQNLNVILQPPGGSSSSSRSRIRRRSRRSREEEEIEEEKNDPGILHAREHAEVNVEMWDN